MALSMDEQRVLAEIERRLTAEDPSLASCMTNFRRPGPAAVLRSPRGRIVGSLFTVLLVAMISLMVYAMIPFRGHATRPANNSQISAPAGPTSHSEIAASTGSDKLATSPAASAGTGNHTATAKTGTSTSTSTTSAATAHSAKASQSHPDQVRANNNAGS
ncbi:MAG TPA: DUF3040 domain-containing protein [Streptosporangiaceae bacterium]|nr:DUF3040 domain-containing protein [Streptosporangiaceae bacterium]